MSIATQMVYPVIYAKDLMGVDFVMGRNTYMYL